MLEQLPARVIVPLATYTPAGEPTPARFLNDSAKGGLLLFEGSNVVGGGTFDVRIDLWDPAAGDWFEAYASGAKGAVRWSIQIAEIKPAASDFDVTLGIALPLDWRVRLELAGTSIDLTGAFLPWR